MTNIVPNLNIKFEDDFDININEEELIKHLDFSQFEQFNNSNNNSNIIQNNKNSIIPASELLNNQIRILNKSEKENSTKDINPNITLNNNSSKMTNMNMPCVYTGEKGGMKGINHEKIEKIIYETTKNSRIFKKNEEDLASIKQEILSLEKN